jgi:zinc protease
MKPDASCIFRNIFLSILMGVLLFSCAPKYAHVFSANGIETDPALVRGVLPNGFQYVLMENTTPKDRVSVHLNVFAGSVHETDEEQGVAHFLEHMLFNGSDHFKPGELIEYFQSIGMDFGADANASTSFFHTTYDLTLPKGDRQSLEDAFRVIQDYAGGALLLEEEIDRERGIILAEKRERDSVSYRTFKQELAFELPGSLLNNRLPIGLTSVIETADRDLLKGFYDRWYRPDNMALVIVGDMDIKETQNLIKQSFSSLQPRGQSAGEAEAVNIAWQSKKGILAFHHYEPEAGNTDITIERISHTPFEPESLEKLKEKALESLGNAIFQNRLSSMIRKESASFSSASIYSGIFLQNISMAALKASCEADKWEKSLGQLEQTLRQALELGFAPKELVRVKADFIAGLDTDVLQADTRKTSQLARSILGAMNQKKIFLSPLQKQALLKPYVQGLTLDQVNQAFQELWTNDQRLVLVSGNAKISDNQELSATDQILDLYEKSAAQSIDPFKRFEAKSFPYLDFPPSTATLVHKQEDVRGLGITQIDLSNNVRLNLKPTDFKNGEFLFKVIFGKGASSEPIDIPGLSSLAESTLQLSGFESMDPDQLGDALAGKDVTIGFSINEGYFAVEGSGDPKQAELIFQLVYTYLKDPGFRPQALALAKTQYRQMYDALKSTPDGIMRIQGNRFLAKGDARFGLLPPESIDPITLEDIQTWLKPNFENSPIEVSVVGDFDPAVITQYATTYLGALEIRTNASNFEKEPDKISFPKGETLNLTLDTKINKGMVRTAFLTDDFWDITKTRKLSLLAKVFSERLRKTIREELGASYSPYVYNNPSLVYDGYGIMHVVVNVLPDTADTVARQMEKIARELSREGITEKEVDLVKKPLLNQIIVLRQTNGYWLNSVLSNSWKHPEKLDWANTIMAGYAAVTHEDLTTLAKQYLTVSDAALIKIVPGVK